MLYSSSLTKYQRRVSRLVRIGNSTIGGKSPIRLQSMTNTSTRDIEKTVDQCKRIIDAGADFVRITAPGVKDAEILDEIKTRLEMKGCTAPLIADIHYSTKAAEIAALLVDKVRINPGNYVDNNVGASIDTTQNHKQEIEKIKIRIAPLIEICRKNNTALRIGVNHGSLSKRIMDTYGDTPEGMAESAMEFLRICEEFDFQNIVVSMKASNTRIMVYANRLLVEKMMSENMDYPLHLGVTEAGEGEDGRIKSAVGIGAMLADGIGETVRVSLTEAPEKEIPVARKIVNHFESFTNHQEIQPIKRYPIKPYEYQRRKTRSVSFIGDENVPVVIGDISNLAETDLQSLKDFGWHFIAAKNTWKFDDNAADFLYIDTFRTFPRFPKHKGIIMPFDEWTKLNSENQFIYPLFTRDTYLEYNNQIDFLHFIIIEFKEITPALLAKIKNDATLVVICKTSNQNGIAEQRRFIIEFMNKTIPSPIIFQREYAETDPESFQLKSACDTGPLFVDGLGDGIWLKNVSEKISISKINQTAFGILQASRMRTTKTEYISCPGCGRTLFNLEETTAKIRKSTSHLKGLKIGIMGCIVNGPGEMADADYGYVGAQKGKITLYKNKEIIKKNIPEEHAIDELVKVIKLNGDWKDPV